MPTPLDYAAQICYSSREVLQFTYEMSVKYKDSPGVYVEAGVAAGAQVIALAYGAPNKTIYAFDSFEGIPLPSNRDDQMPGIAKLSQWEIDLLPPPGKQVLKTSGATIVSYESFTEHMVKGGVDSDHVVVVIGWFEDTVPFYQDGMPEISILRLDGDLYNSTYVCLKHLYPKVINGGIIIIDDWQLPGCRAAVVDYLSEIGIREHAFQFLDGTAYFFK